MTELETPLPARYPKIALFTLWFGAFGAAVPVSMFDAEVNGQNLVASILSKTLLLGLLGIGAGVALTALLVVMRVNRLLPLFSMIVALLLACLGLTEIAESSSPGLGFDLIIGLIAVVCSMAAYLVLFLLALLCVKVSR